MKNPTFEIHYNPRKGGEDTNNAKPMSFALVLTIHCKNEPQLYNKIVARYPAYLQQIQPIRLPAGFV